MIPVIPGDYESGQIPGIPGVNLMIIPAGILLQRESTCQKKVHRIPEIPEIPFGITGIRPE